LSFFSTFQKMLIGAPLELKGYIVPFAFGGTTGLALGIWQLRLRLAKDALQEASDDLQRRVEARTAELSNANERLSRERDQHWQAEQATKESEHRLGSILEAMQAGILIMEAETHQIVDANPAALQLIGLQRDQVVGRVCHNFVCPAEKDNCPITDLGHTLDNSERVLLNASGDEVPILKTVVTVVMDSREYLIESFLDITERKQAEQQREILVKELQDSLAKIKTLKGLLPICASCKKIRDDKGYWNRIESYLKDHSDAELSHSICPECAKNLYPELYEKNKKVLEK